VTVAEFLLGLVRVLVWPAILVWLIFNFRSALDGLLRRAGRTPAPAQVTAEADSVRASLAAAKESSNRAARDKLQRLEGELEYIVTAYTDQYQQRLRFQRQANEAADQLQRLLPLIRPGAHSEQPPEEIISDTNRLIGRIQGWYLG
jgi:hypothetical protein